MARHDATREMRGQAARPGPAATIRGVRSLLLLSILFATLLLPSAAAWGGRPRAALRALLVVMFASEVAYGFYLYAGFGRL